ncbi:MAG TPA: RNA polymerase sigma factor [Stellaceae bacterium]|jgi:RNA polymerase sigma-70 factor (ECF subfamily)|nr:RNA polymerase sigma factor [Stellaceae bacterium]
MTIDDEALAESDLVRRARAREEEAIRAIIQRHNRRLYRIARGILRDDAEAEDALQDAYLKAFSQLGGFRGEAGIGTWLSRIVINEALARLRRRRPTIDWDAIGEGGIPGAEAMKLSQNGARPDPERALAQSQIRRLLEEAIDRLPEEFRLVLLSRAVEEMSIEETASVLGILPETVKTRLHRARRQLRTALEAQIGPILKDVFPFEDPRCRRVADAVMQGLGKFSPPAREPLAAPRI